MEKEVVIVAKESHLSQWKKRTRGVLQVYLLGSSQARTQSSQKGHTSGRLELGVCKVIKVVIL